MRVALFLLLGFSPVYLRSQDPNGNYNPYVNAGIITPSPLWPLEADGNGIVSFNIGNTGSDALDVFTDQSITLTITLSYGVPDHSNPISAVSGSYSGLFTWSYSSGTFTGRQIKAIAAESSGTINIAYKVAQNSSSPGSNGFNVNVAPAPYQTTSNTQNDDAVSSYTYTEIRDFGDAPVSYGSADHSMDFTNYLGSICDGEATYQASTTASADDFTGLDDEDGVIFPSPIQQGETINIPVTVAGLGRLNAWIDWNGDGDFDDSGERIANNIGRFEGSDDLLVAVPEGASVSAPTFARFRFSPGTLASSTGSATGGEVEDYRITISASSLSPTVPTGLEISSFSQNQVNLSWDASTDNVGVTGYRIYRGGVFLGESTVTNYSDNLVSDGHTYSYNVSAFNAAGYESGHSSPVSVTIEDVTPPSIPDGLKVNSATGNEISLSWNPSTDNVGVAGYRVFRMGSLVETTIDLQFTDNTVIAGNTYIYTISAFDAAGNASIQSSGLSADASDPEIQVQSITVSGAGGQSELINGATLQFSAKVLPENATNNKVTWSVNSLSGDAIITQGGLLTATSEGLIVVEATAKDGSGVVGVMHVTINLLNIGVTSISVSSLEVENQYFVGGTYQFLANVLPVDATDKRVEWSVDLQTGSGTISQDGSLYAISEGVILIIAEASDGSGVTGSLQISLETPTNLITGLEVFTVNGQTEIGVGELHPFGVRIQPDNVDLDEVQWSIENKSGSATITQDGLLTAVKEGFVNVIALALDGSGMRDTMQIQIIDDLVVVNKIFVYSETGATDIGVGETIQIFAEVFPLNANNRKVNWTITEPTTGEAMITEDGLLTGVSVGSLEIVANATDGSGVSCALNITISDHTGVYETQTKGILIYPNPSNGIVYIDRGYVDIDIIQIIDASGSVISVVVPEPGAPIMIVDMSAYPLGSYFFNLTSGNFYHVRQVIVSQ